MNRIAFFILVLLPFSLLSDNYSELPDDELVKLAENGDSEAQYQLGLYLEELKYSDDQLRFSYIERNPYKWYVSAASGNQPDALTKVGKEYLSKFGYFKKQDYGKAVSHFQNAASANSESALLLSILKYWGIGTEQNKEEALNYFRQSVANFHRFKSMIYLEKELIDMIRELGREDNPEALFAMGDLYYFGKTNYYKQDYKKALRLYSQSAELSNCYAAYMLGMMYYNGTGTLKDLKKSYRWIARSAELECMKAQVKIGIMNYFGEGTEVNTGKAFYWFSLTAPKNDPLSQYFLGVMYYKGEGTEKDLSLSKKWIKEAYDNGSASAKKFWDSKELWKAD